MRNAVSTGAATEDPPRSYIRASYLSLLKGAYGVGFFYDVSKPPQTLFSQIKLQASGTSLVHPRKLYGFGDLS
jgi:hypothetical protein